jgi:hypothetical protein
MRPGRGQSKNSVPPEVVPEELSFEVMFVASFPMGLQWVKDHFELRGLRQEVLFNPTPSAADWKRFWLKVEQLGVWVWDPRYDNFDILDGVAWELSMRYQGKAIHSEGTNSFPGIVKDAGEYTATYLEFLKALRTLAGLPTGLF